MAAAKGRENPSAIGRAPVADVRPTDLKAHGETRVDNYYWMRDREGDDVRAYLEAENAYANENLEPSAEVSATLFKEFKSRIQETDMTVPVPDGPFEYYTRTQAGKAYPIHCRRPSGQAGGRETVLMDVNQMAAGKGFFQLGGQSVSADHRWVASATDSVGRRIYDIEIKNIGRGDIQRGIEGASGSMAWSSDSQYLFYVKRDPVTLRACEVWRHRVDAPADRDVKVYEETDDTFSCYLSTARDRQHILLTSSQTLTTEVRFLRADDPLGDWQVLLPREVGHRYDVEIVGERLYIRTNKDAQNFKLVIAPIAEPSRWTQVLRHRIDTLLSSVDVFDGYFVAQERRGGLVRLVVHPSTMDSDVEPFEVPFDEAAYDVGLTGNREFSTRKIRYRYSSLSTPPSTVEFDVGSRETTVLKTANVGAGFSSDDYLVERVFASAEDGAQIPISLVYRKERAAGAGPLLLYGYGSYGASLDAGFSSNVVSLLDRGFAYAIAHVRGGQELGRFWYDFGKLEHKMNTFTDFIACAEELCERGLTEPGQLYARGGSAGGLLMGAICNMRPDLFHGVVAAVPFVDVVTTMLDESIPLTTFEYDEWGNPNEEAAYRTMLEYSPYDQVREQPYPNLLVTTGFHDSQVQYWEPAKWVAKLRAQKTDDSLLVFHCEMEAGHGGSSGRYNRLREAARDYGFLLWLQGLSESTVNE